MDHHRGPGVDTRVQGRIKTSVAWVLWPEFRPLANNAFWDFFETAYVQLKIISEMADW